jgi:hypothetical protein
LSVETTVGMRSLTLHALASSQRDLPQLFSLQKTKVHIKTQNKEALHLQQQPSPPATLRFGAQPPQRAQLCVTLLSPPRPSGANLSMLPPQLLLLLLLLWTLALHLPIVSPSLRERCFPHPPHLGRRPHQVSLALALHRHALYTTWLSVAQLQRERALR